MKILKKPENVIYDTENSDEMKFNRVPLPLEFLTPLQKLTTKTIFDFLSENFKPINELQHPIFKDFGNSYFYYIKYYDLAIMIGKYGKT